MSGNILKFGGTSLCDAASIKKCAEIISKDKNVSAVVVSAPGKRYGEEKITDLLFGICADPENSAAMDKVERRFDDMIRELDVGLDFSSDYNAVINAAKSGDTQYAVSRGEYFSAKITAAYLGFKFIDAADVIKFSGGALDRKTTYKKISDALALSRPAVIPGFYGSDGGGKIVTFPRGGSDITGAVVAAASGAEIYKNYTDVSGFMFADPEYSDKMRPIDRLSYGEAYFLARGGARVIHCDAVKYAEDGGIPIVIKNTFSPSDDGTVIDSGSRRDGIYGVAGKMTCGYGVISVGCRGDGAAEEIKRVINEAGGGIISLETGDCGVVVTVEGRRFGNIMRALSRIE